MFTCGVRGVNIHALSTTCETQFMCVINRPRPSPICQRRFKDGFISDLNVPLASTQHYVLHQTVAAHFVSHFGNHFCLNQLNLFICLHLHRRLETWKLFFLFFFCGNQGSDEKIMLRMQHKYHKQLMRNKDIMNNKAQNQARHDMVER